MRSADWFELSVEGGLLLLRTIRQPRTRAAAVRDLLWSVQRTWSWIAAEADAAMTSDDQRLVQPHEHILTPPCAQPVAAPLD